MVGLRKLVYASQGSSYDFGHRPAELLYEYSKDVRTFIGLAVMDLDRVASIEPLQSADARVHLDDGTALPCSRR